MALSGRDTPKDVQSGAFGFEPDAISAFDQEGATPALDPETARKLAREIWETSTSWINSGPRARWANSLRAFNGQHPSGSKYASREFSYRSSLYRPKTRAMVRKAEAQTASAFFSNEDVVSIQAENPDDNQQQASADFMQALLQYRLTKSIPWFVTVVGARQDCEVMGACAAKAYWKYEDRDLGTEKQPRMGADGMPVVNDAGEQQFDDVPIKEKIADKPCLDLIPLENLRFDPGCDWRDPAVSSPYIVEAIPMYIQDIEDRIDKGEWFPVSESALRASTNLSDDATRRARERNQVPGKDSDSGRPRAFDIGWVHENIVKWKGEDWHYFSLGESGELLSDPVHLDQVYLHGERPYVVGNVVLETHKTYATSKVELVRDLQRAANDDWNLRFDQMKLSLNPRQFVKIGAGVEISDVRTFMPGKVVLTKDPNSDIVWDRPPEPSASAYQEADRINLDFDELVGDFSNTSVAATQAEQQSATGMNLMSGQASGMNEYELRMFAETFVERVIRLLVKLEQHYETDPVILAIAGKNAQLIQKYGINQITDDLLNQELTTRVNVGIGATNPVLKMKNLLSVSQALGAVFGPIAAQGANFDEVAKELFGLAGYKDGDRFLKQRFDPQVAQLQQQIQQLQAKQKAPAAGQPPDTSKLEAAQITAQGKLQAIQAQGALDNQQQQSEMQANRESEEAENWRVQFKAQQEMALARMNAAVDAMEGHANRTAAAEKMKDATAAKAAPKPVAEPVPVAPAPDPTVPGATDHALALMAATMGQMAQAINALQAHLSEGHQQVAGAMQNLAAAHAAPKRVVRDAQGKAIGMEAMVENAGMPKHGNVAEA